MKIFNLDIPNTSRSAIEISPGAVSSFSGSVVPYRINKGIYIQYDLQVASDKGKKWTGGISAVERVG